LDWDPWDAEDEGGKGAGRFYVYSLDQIWTFNLVYIYAEFSFYAFILYGLSYGLSYSMTYTYIRIRLYDI
jgi:hypothetical protein